MKIIKPILIACKFVLIGVLSAALLFCMIGIVKRVFFKEDIPLVLGFGNAVILTGSMEPAISPGDVVIIQKQNDYDVGDIVTCKAGSYITHRITEKTLGGYLTQGDANNVHDPEIDRSQIVGKVIKIIPKVGNITLSLQNPLYLLILLLVLFAVVEAPGLLKKRS